jgi:hypothetical protein
MRFLRAGLLFSSLLACESPENDATTSSSSQGGAAVSSSASSTSSGEGGATGGGGAAAGGAPTGLRFNEVYQKAIHNSYERDEALFDQLVYHRVRALELDIHVGKWTWPDVAGNWYVFHENGPVLNETTCHRLTDCLADLAQFERAVPDHEVVTVFIDLKDDWDNAGHRPDDLDAVLEAGLGPERIFAPSDFLKRCPAASSLREAATQCGFPTLDELRGKWIFALTGGSACDDGSPLAEYGGGAGRAAFIAPGLTDTCTLADAASRPEQIFYNGDFGQIDAAEEVEAAGLMMRIYKGGLDGGLDDVTSWSSAAAKKAHFLATDKVNFEVDGWAKTHNIQGYPFACLAPNCDVANVSEASPPIGIEVSSGDLGPNDDSGMFIEAPLSGDMLLEAAISTRNSSVEPFAKGCLMVRETTDPKSPFFAVCRPADANVVRVELRSAAGAASEVTDKDIVAADTVDQESVVWIRLQTIGVTARGYASLDGVSWTLIRTFSFATTPPYRGIWASGHDSPQPVRFLFQSLRSINNNQPMRIDADMLATPTFMKNATGSIHDRPVWP